MIPNNETELRAHLGQDPESFPVNWMVEAGAGAGKTFLIVQRIVSQLAAGYCRPEQLVAITFTNKAANQLRDRLTEALRKRRAAAADPGEQARLDNALQNADSIQISTVHSFCQRLLREMPLEAGLPFSFTLQEEGEARRDATRFFDECCRDHDDWFAPVRAFGIQPTSLKESFLSLLDCGDDEIVQYDAAAFAEPDKKIAETAEAVRQKLVQSFPAGWKPEWCAQPLLQLLEYPTITTPAQAMGWLDLLKAFAALSAQPRSVEEYKLPIIIHKPGTTSGHEYSRREFHVVLFLSPNSPVCAPWHDFFTAFDRFAKADANWYKAQKKSDQAKIQQAQDARKKAAKQLSPHKGRLECRFVQACYTLLQTRGELAASLQQSVNQLLHAAILPVLLRCRNALAERRTARGQLGYDDLLLRCRDLLKNSPSARKQLTDRQLILYVDEFQDTDPVQAQILFYLTAEPSTFNQDWTRCVPRPGSLFLVGDPKQSIYRFRRADIQIYNRVRALFDGPLSHCRLAVLRFNFRSSKALCDYATTIFQGKMTPANDQPVFSPMEAQKQTPDRTVWNLTVDPQAAPDGVAAWIDQAVAGKQARWRDFLILCDKKDQVELYRNALRARHIPVNATGQHHLADTAPIARCADWCRYLLHPWDPLAAMPLLAKAGIGPATLYALKQSGEKGLADMLRRKPDQWPQPADAALEEAAQMFRRMALLREKARSLPPMALLEELLSGDYGLWDDAPDPESYGWVREYLAKLRQWPDQSLTRLLNQAIRLCDSKPEHPMAYTDNADEVQVMNLHKAKGLEGRIVFLAPGVHKVLRISRHLQDGQAWLCLSARLDGPDGGHSSVTATPPQWQDRLLEETALDNAERLRLLYVAATRAEELLIVGHAPAPKSNTASPFNEKDAWKDLVGEATLTPDTPDLLPGIPAQALFAPQNHPSRNIPATLTLPGHEADTALRQGLTALPEAARTSITPSKLDHPAPPPTLDPEAEAPALPELPASPEHPDPHGGDWGTIIHRTLELAVNQSAWSPEKLAPLAAQAVRETLPENLPLTARQYRQLTGDETPVPYARLTADLAGRAQAACAPVLADGSPLRALLDQGEAATEYPFYLAVSDPEDGLYRHLLANLPKTTARGVPIDLNGILDLGIRTPEGWTVVDYKTDRRAPGETEEQYCRRLRSHYDPQLRTYAMVLERLERLPVRCFVCAVPLGGRLIELNDTPAPLPGLPGDPQKEAAPQMEDDSLHFSALLYDHALRPSAAPADGTGSKNDYPGLAALAQTLRKYGHPCTRKQSTLDMNGQKIQIRFRDDTQGTFAAVDENSLVFAIRRGKINDTYTMICGTQSELGASTSGSWSLGRQNESWTKEVPWPVLNEEILKIILGGSLHG